jgi:hypothetical protein
MCYKVIGSGKAFEDKNIKKADNKPPNYIHTRCLIKGPDIRSTYWW